MTTDKKRQGSPTVDATPVTVSESTVKNAHIAAIPNADDDDGDYDDSPEGQAALLAWFKTAEPPPPPAPARDPINGCGWYEGDTKGAEPCGLKCKPGSSFCPEHHARVWRKAKAPARISAAVVSRYGEGDSTRVAKDTESNQWITARARDRAASRAVISEEHGGSHILDRGGRRNDGIEE